ncbi:uncharacterized protein METZ01_LOCUS441699, partial [marine metagenome]
MKNIVLIIFFCIIFSSTEYKKIKSTKFYDLNGIIPNSINLNEFILDFDKITKIKHYSKSQEYNNILVFGRNIILHYNVNNIPSSMSNNYHHGEFKNSSPSISLESAKIIVRNDFPIENFIFKNVNLIYYVKDDVALLVHHMDAVSYSKAYRYLISAHNGDVVKKWSLIHNDGPTIGSGENLLDEWVNTLHVYEGTSFESMGDLISPNLICEEYCWDYGDCDGGNYDNCVLSYSPGNCPENYLEDCNGQCFHS